MDVIEEKTPAIVVPEVIKPLMYIESKITRGTRLKFTPYVWSKILYMRDAGPTEVGGYGITGTSDPLLITDFFLIKQECTSYTVELDTEDSLKFVEEMDDKGLSPWQYGSIWIHTHPGNCAKPSGTDEVNFDKNFSTPHCAIFFILAREGDTYCRLRYNVGPGTEVTIETEIDYSEPFPPSRHKEWKEEYEYNVSETKTYIANTPFADLYRGKTGSTSAINNLLKTVDEDHKDIISAPKNVGWSDKSPDMWYDYNEDVVFFENTEIDDYWKYDPLMKMFYNEDDLPVTRKDASRVCNIAEVVQFAEVSLYESSIDTSMIVDELFHQKDDVDVDSLIES